MRPRLLAALATAVTALLLPFGLALPAHAGGTDERVVIATIWTQPTTPSVHAWNSARLDPDRWADYAFDWSTDYCTLSPNRPLGFDFRRSCQRHDFGYRNFKAFGLFADHKARVDDAFYFDMMRVCDTYSWGVRHTCYGVAWLYYEAVSTFGHLAVSTEQINEMAVATGSPELIARTA